MSEIAHLTGAFVILAALTVLSLVGTFVTSPVLGIFVVVFALGSALVLHELRNLR